MPIVGGSLRASFTNKAGRHAIAEILLKVALNTKIQIQIQILPRYHRMDIIGRNNFCGVIIFIDQKSKIASLQDIRKNIKNFLWNNNILLNPLYINKDNNKITDLWTILQRESQNS